MKRQNFLALIGIGNPGIWIDGPGLTPLSKNIVNSIIGKCSFCGKSAKEVLCMAGVISRLARICNECIDICLEIQRDNIQTVTSAVPPAELPMSNDNANVSDFSIPNAPINLSSPNTKAELKVFIDQWRNLINQGRRMSSELLCSFCDRTRDEGGNFVAGPKTFICKSCVSEIATNMKTIR